MFPDWRLSHWTDCRGVRFGGNCPEGVASTLLGRGSLVSGWGRGGDTNGLLHLLGRAGELYRPSWCRAAKLAPSLFLPVAGTGLPSGTVSRTVLQAASIQQTGGGCVEPSLTSTEENQAHSPTGMRLTHSRLRLHRVELL